MTSFAPQQGIAVSIVKKEAFIRKRDKSKLFWRVSVVVAAVAVVEDYNKGPRTWRSLLWQHTK